MSKAVRHAPNDSPTISVAPIRRDHAPVGEEQPVGDGADVAVDGDERERGGAVVSLGIVEIEAEVPDVGVAVTVDDHVVAVVAGDVGQVGHLDQVAVDEGEQAAVGHGHDEQGPVRAPSESRRPGRDLDDGLGLARTTGRGP